MRHIGDITKIDGALIEPVNVIIGGSPCQDLSIAGKRAGLAGERSGLFMEQIRVIKEMRYTDHVVRKRNGSDIRPRFMVWENVPGAFSSNGGGDFAAVLEETLKVCGEEIPSIPVPKNGWPTAGCIVGMGGEYSLAWRVFDAQFWGVPQRRRRIALVADFGGASAPEILFERESVSRDFEESGQTRKRAAADAQNGPTGNDPILGGVAGFNGHKSTSASIQYAVEKAPTIEANMPPDVICMATQQGGAEIRTDDKAPTLTAAAGMSGNNQPVICIQGNCIDRADTAGCNGKGWKEGVSYTLNTIDRPAVAVAVVRDDITPKFYDGEVSPTISARDYKGAICVAQEVPTAYALDQQGGKGSAAYAEDVSPTLCSDSHGTPHAVAYAIENHPQDSRVKLSEDNVVQTLNGKMGTGGGNTPMILECYDVRFSSDGTKNQRGHVYKTDTSRSITTTSQDPSGNHGGGCDNPGDTGRL